MNEVALIHKLLSKPRLYKQITMKDLSMNHEVNHLVVTFVDDASSCLGGQDERLLQTYMKDYLILLLFFYRANNLKLNDNKTLVLILQSNYRKCISLIAENGKEVIAEINKAVDIPIISEKTEAKILEALWKVIKGVLLKKIGI